MAKGKDESSPANDYIDQLQWQAQYRRRIPVRFEPKWKYKIVYRYPPTTGFERAIGLALVTVIIVAVGALLWSDVATIGEKIFFGAVAGIIFMILFFAVRDASEGTDKKTDD